MAEWGVREGTVLTKDRDVPLVSVLEHRGQGAGVENRESDSREQGSLSVIRA